MQIKCLYCDSLIESESNSTCPCCGANIAESLREAEAEEEKKLQAEKEAQREAEEAALKEEQKSEAIQGIMTLAGGLLGLSASRNNRNRRNAFETNMGRPNSQPPGRPDEMRGRSGYPGQSGQSGQFGQPGQPGRNDGFGNRNQGRDQEWGFSNRQCGPGGNNGRYETGAGGPNDRLGSRVSGTRSGRAGGSDSRPSGGPGGRAGGPGGPGGGPGGNKRNRGR